MGFKKVPVSTAVAAAQNNFTKLNYIKNIGLLIITYHF